jgi:tRNA(fMet)-specific endonuclease VapC
MKQILVDTDILSYYLRNQPVVVRNFENHLQQFGFLYISRISVYEALSGLKYKDADKQITEFRNLLRNQKIVELTEESTEISSDIYAMLRKIGKLSGRADIFIAGIAIQNNLILATNNIKHYENIPNLEIINWTE